ncbi:alginate lyase family protein [Lutibacter sp.]|uniref:alginate lyase family protein n=1 Tax=Lutibacter sp. TaxID=1925666 RepID=UPI0025B8470B|nr:alginate lyase family protein [Lutibacter sp.]MBT8317844.1 alginate lyase family protein [Lutibacter sp.]
MKIYIITTLCFISTVAFSNSFVHLDSLALAKAKTMIFDGTATNETLKAYEKLIINADNLLTCKNPSVMDKTILPPTGNKHDYLSISRYWWPDTKKKDGLPWVRFDGKTNPDTQTDAVDRKRLGFMGKSVRDLSLAYYFTNDEKYAQKAISMIDTWFVNSETLMNPNLEFAQSVPGNPNNRRSGILDGRSIVMFVPDAIQLLSISKHWNTNYKTKTTKWFSDYLTWLTKSDLGKKGSEQKNNHGSWYKYQVATLAYYLDNKPLVKKMVTLAQQSLDDMLNDKGGQIHELERSRSFFYSCFNLQALVAIAELGNKVGMDMWHYQSENKKSLQLAINYLTPTINGKKWNHNTIKNIDLTDLIPILSKASKNENSQEYNKLLSKILSERIQKKQNDKLLEFWLLNTIN